MFRPVISTAQQLDVLAPRTPALGLRQGQTLRALVVQGTPPGQGGGQALLAVGRLTLPVRAQLPLPAGLDLTVQVARLQPTLSLKILTDALPGGAAQSADAGARRQWMPRQGGLPPLASALAQTARGQSGAPESTAASARRVLAALPQRGEVTTPEGIRNAVSRSGLFLEAHLARALTGGNLPESDLKALLLQFLGRLPAGARPGGAPQQTPPPPWAQRLPTPQGRTDAPPGLQNPREALALLRQLAEGALARIGLHQLASREPQAEGETRSWVFELPVRQDEQTTDVLHLRIREEASHKGQDAEPRWSVDLALDLPGLGPLQVRIGIQGSAVTTRFRAERETTAERIRSALPQLQEALQARDLTIGPMSCRQGRMEETGESAPAENLVDTRA